MSKGLSIRNLVEELSFRSEIHNGGFGSSRDGSKHWKIAMMPSRTSGFTRVPLLLKQSQRDFARDVANHKHTIVESRQRLAAASEQQAFAIYSP